MDEYLDIVDDNNRMTGRTKLKSEIHRDGDWHRAAHIWICNEKRELLFQLRSPEKDTYPDLWDITGGHVGAGESYEDAAVRELEEELGISATIDDLTPLFLQKNKKIGNEFQMVFLLRSNRSIDTLRLQAEEVVEARYISMTELRRALTDPVERLRFCPVYDYYLSTIDMIEARLSDQQKR